MYTQTPLMRPSPDQTMAVIGNSTYSALYMDIATTHVENERVMYEMWPKN